MSKKKHDLSAISDGLVVKDIDTDEVLHFVGFWSRVTKKEIEALKEELLEDPDFDWLDDVPYEIVRASAEEMAHYKQIIAEAGESIINEDELL